MPSGPAYEFGGGSKPDVAWERPSGGVVCLWAREWHNLLGAEVLKVSGAYSWESWQPDLRADKVYSAALPTGVTHRLFPAVRGLYRVGLRKQECVFSEAMLAELEKAKGERLVLMLGATYGFHNPFYRSILSALGPGRRFPVFLRSDGMFNHPLGEFLAPHKPLTYLSLLLEHFEVKKLLACADVISEQSASGLSALTAVYKGRIERLPMGCDFSFWRPPSGGERAAARKLLGIGDNKKVFFASGNFLPRKQLDKLVEVFLSLQGRDDFFLLLAGQGPAAAITKLERLCAPLADGGRALLHGYAEGEELRALYHASDVYVSCATDEGGPVSVMKALGCGLPVLSTPVGDTAEFLSEQRAGRLVPVRDYAAWKSTVAQILDAGSPKAADVSAARERYDWPNIARRCVRVLDDLSRSYFH